MVLNFSEPYGITKYNGFFYVANANTSSPFPCVGKYNSDLSVNNLSFYTSGLNDPRGMVVDTSGYLFLANFSNNTILKISTSSPGTGSIWGTGINHPYDMAIDYTNGLMYVSSNSGNIFTYNYPSGGGALTANWSSGYNNPCQLQLVYPNLYIADNDGVWVVDVTTQSGNVKGTQIISSTNTSGSVGMCISGDYLYLTTSLSEIISVYNVNTHLLVSGSWKSGFNQLGYLYNDNNTQIYATDNRNNQVYSFNPYGICFLKGTKILCQENGEEIYKPIEEIQPGTLVKTLKHGFVATEIVNQSSIYNSGDIERVSERLYLLSKSIYPQLNENLVITGGHSILVDSLTVEQKETIVKDLETVFVTEGKYRLPAYIDEQAIPYPIEGNFDIYHIYLENANEQSNYGIYANGLLVESCCKRHII
jgi:hypothetical protein